MSKMTANPTVEAKVQQPPLDLRMRMLKPGLYRLTREIRNPCSDGRVKGDWTASNTVPEGTRFLVTEEQKTLSLPSGERLTHYTVLQRLDGISVMPPRLTSSNSEDLLFAALAMGLEPCGESLGAGMTLAGIHSREDLELFLCCLVDSFEYQVADSGDPSMDEARVVAFSNYAYARKDPATEKRFREEHGF